ncbi:hypothetical protein LguiA_008147 [Lonicera macranthoides]
MPEKKAVSWNAMLSGYAQNGFAEEAVELFNEMMNASVQTDKNFWVVVISSCSPHDISHVTIEHRNIEMDGYAEHGRVGDACEVFDEMSEVTLVIRIR